MNFLLAIIITALIFILVAQSWNLVYGYTDMLHLGHIGFFAIGAYTSALLTIQGVNFWIALIIAGTFAGFIGFLLAIPTVRFKFDYLAIVTLGFGEIIRNIIINWSSLTRGPLGLPGIPSPTLFGITFDNNSSYLLLMILVTIVLGSFMYRIAHSPFGMILRSIKDNDIAAHTIGKHINAYRIKILVMSAVIVAIIGAFFVHYTNFTEPNVYRLELMALIILAVFAGGPGKFWGTVIAAGIVITIRETFILIDFIPASITGPLMWIVLSLALVLILMYKPNGLFGKKLESNKY
jgi:branched-chain amino acid transport system permease protein